MGASYSGKYSSPARGGSTYGAEKKRQSPLKQGDEEELARAFKEEIALEKELEDAKIKLSMNSDFNLTDAFNMIDRNSNGFISPNEISDALQEMGVYALKEDVYLFVKRYDRNQDGKLRYSEFVDAFTPKSVLHSSTLNARKGYYSQLGYPKNEYFTRDTRDLFARTFKTHFSVETSYEYLRKRLFRRPGFNASDAFSACDYDKNGYITRDEFKTILRDYGFYATDTELSWLLDRYDKNQDGKISYSEFIDEILPKSPARR
jgi:Ca2+-binding EF-hand superfamily protein